MMENGCLLGFLDPEARVPMPQKDAQRDCDDHGKNNEDAL